MESFNLTWRKYLTKFNYYNNLYASMAIKGNKDYGSGKLIAQRFAAEIISPGKYCMICVFAWIIKKIYLFKVIYGKILKSRLYSPKF